MPYELAIPKALKPWKVKIFDNELLCEEPHVTIIFKMTRWRLSLRSGNFLDQQPDPKDVRQEVREEIERNWEVLRGEWDARFPTNPVQNEEQA